MCRINECDPWKLGTKLLKYRDHNMKTIKNFRTLYTNYHKNPMPIIPDDLSDYGADQQYAFGRHRSRVTIEQYVFCKYRITLRYPQLPCVIMYGGNGHRSFYPLELLYISPHTSNHVDHNENN